MKRKIIILFMVAVSFVMAKNVYAEQFNGEYSIDYLLRNYNAVTFNNKKYNIPSLYKVVNYYSAGSVYEIQNIEGAVLISGDYDSTSPAEFGIADGNVKSFVGGELSNAEIVNEFNFVTDPNYIDFNKLYINVVNESQWLAEASENIINKSKIEISKPGIYTINNTAIFYSQFSEDPSTNRNAMFFNNQIFIDNYDRNAYYVFNYYDEYVESIPDVFIMDDSSPRAVTIAELAESGAYSGNIIFNFPNAKYIKTSFDEEKHFYLNHRINNSSNVSGSIIAPKAYVDIQHNYLTSTQLNSKYYGTIIANTIAYDSSKFRINRNTYPITTSLIKGNYSVNKDLMENSLNYSTEPQDYNDDIYTRDYSINDLLQNYNVVTLGHKQLDFKTKLSKSGYRSGSVRLFHITGQTLINGDLYGNVYENEVDDYRNNETYANYTYQKFDRIAFDLESNKVTESFINGDVLRDVKVTAEKNYSTHEITVSTSRLAIPVIQPWDNMANDNLEFHLKKNKIYIGQQSFSNNSANVGRGNFSGTINNYLNFDRLYNNVVAEQKGIEEGDKVKASNGVAHIPIGGNYVIDDVSDINKIIFDNFEENKDVITVVTIKNSGDINFPEINKDKGYYKGIITNDYYGKKQATHLYERDTFVTEDGYYGNIIFNVPNATYIKLKENVPFAGHLIAPNADVETEETHFAGCFIVNSIYGEGNTEAHFYPLTAYDNCECSVGDQVPESLHARFNELRLSRLLGGEKSIVETNIIGDQVQYKKDTDQLNQIIDNCPLRKHSSSLNELLNNPPTYGTIGAVLLIVIGLIIGFEIYKRKNKNNTY